MSTPHFPRHAKRRRGPSGTSWLIGLAILAAILVGVGVTVAYFSSMRVESSCVLDSKERTVKSGGEQVKYIYTSCGVFTVDDAPFLFRFNSADLYGSLKEGESYDLTVVGWRNGFFSLFPNTVEAQPVS